jgi:hypothetical protein
MRTVAYAATILASVVLLGACAAPAEPAGAAASPAPPAAVATPTPTPTPSPTPARDPADPSTWIISETGMGPLVLDQPFSQAVAQLPSPVERDLERCTNQVWWRDADDSALVILHNGSNDAAPLHLVMWADWVEPYDVGGPRTAKGIGVGSTVDEVRAAYPDAVETTQAVSPDIHYLAVGTVFFSYREPSTVINVVTVTAADQPPYELCG